jgi:20S proteasome alpha/beta subunit
MQIAMVGKDGIVLASDTTWLSSGEFAGQIRSTFPATKIRISDAGDIAVSQARNMETSSLIAREIAQLDGGHISAYSLEGIANDILGRAGKRADVQCLVVSVKPNPRLFRLWSMPERKPGNRRMSARAECVEIPGAAIAGDDQNAAVFLSLAYYADGLTLDCLTPLAAHLVLAASKLNSGAIGGLEVVWCTRNNGCRHLSSEALERLKLLSCKLDEQARLLLATHGEQFAYAPSVIG